MEFKDRLKSLRESKKLTTTQLATHFEKSEGAIRMWESGRSKPDADTLIRLSEYFGVSTDFLLGIEKNASTGRPDELEKLLVSIEKIAYPSFCELIESKTGDIDILMDGLTLGFDEALQRGKYAISHPRRFECDDEPGAVDAVLMQIFIARGNLSDFQRSL